MFKDDCAVALRGRHLKLAQMTNAQLIENNEIAKAYIFLALEDKGLFNVQIVDTTTKVLWDSLNMVYEDKFLRNKIYLRIAYIRYTRINLWGIRFYLRRRLYNLRTKGDTLFHKPLNVSTLS